MLKIVTPLLLAAAVISCNNAASDKTDNKDTSKQTTLMSSNTLTDQQKADGWMLLFDGQTTKGWHKYGGEPVGSAWKVTDGVLHVDASEKDGWQIKGGGDIVTDEEFENFHLKLEWKIDTCGNSGVMFYIHEDSVKYKHPWMTGPEMQILDNACHPDAKIGKHKAGDLYDILAGTPDMSKPALEWNQVEIKCVNGALEFYFNGTKIVSTTMWDDAWKEGLKTTKWKDHKDFSTYKKGRIGLQDHGNNVWFRNIMIKKL